jgi:hypothetical protein
MKLFRNLLPWAGLAMWLALTLAACSWNWRQVFVARHVYFTDPDCYSRMTRAQRVLAAPWKPIRFHDFENAPTGIVPHTTAPFDLLLAALAKAFQLSFKILGVHSLHQPLDLAGAFLSPLLGMTLVAFLWWWGRRLALPNRNAVLAIAAISPILAHGFEIGRPDHQSLIILLVGAALAAEIALWRQPSQAWEICCAALWALALWTSLFEPLILFGAAALIRLGVLGRKALPNRTAALVFVLVLVGALLFDGWRVRTLSAEERSYFFRWTLNIGELRHATLSQLIYWTGWLLVVAPAVLLWRFWKSRDRSCVALAALVFLLTGLSLWHMRWGYFLAIAFALSLPWVLCAIPWKPVAWLALGISLWPVAGEWDRLLFPDEQAQITREEDREDALLLRETAEALISPERKVILAPWWLSPAIAYWSGQSCVGGSSHQSLPGTVDSSRFFLSTVPEEAREILRKRSVDYVVAYEPERVISNSAQILGLSAPERPLGEILYDHPHAAPSFLRLVYENRFFKVFEFVD